MNRHSLFSTDADDAATSCCDANCGRWRCSLSPLSSSPPLAAAPSSQSALPASSSPPVLLSASASSASPNSTASSSGSPASSSSAVPPHNPCHCRKCTQGEEPAQIGPLLHPAHGEWSASGLAARIASLPVLHPTDSLLQCQDWPFFLELSTDLLAEWNADQLSLVLRLIAQGPTAAVTMAVTKYTREMDNLYAASANLYLPAMSVLALMQRDIGWRIDEIMGTRQRTNEFVHLTSKQHARCLERLRLHQKHLLQLTCREFDRLRAECQSIALALHIEEMEAEAEPWAQRQWLDVKWHEQFLGA